MSEDLSELNPNGRQLFCGHDEFRKRVAANYVSSTASAAGSHPSPPEPRRHKHRVGLPMYDIAGPKAPPPETDLETGK